MRINRYKFINSQGDRIIKIDMLREISNDIFMIILEGNIPLKVKFF